MIGVAATLLFLSGCDRAPPEVGICEKFIKAGLETPATYHRISYSIYNTGPMPGTQLWVDAGRPDPNDDKNPILREAAQRRDKESIIRRDVQIVYDANNAYNAPIRALNQCAFRIGSDGTFDEQSSNADADRAITDASTRQLVEGGVLPNLNGTPPSKPGFDCCMPGY